MTKLLKLKIKEKLLNISIFSEYGSDETYYDMNPFR